MMDKREKAYNILSKWNLMALVAILILFVNSLAIFTFKSTSVKPTYFLRILVLISAFIMVLAVCIELYNVIYRFIKTKNKKKFIIEIALLFVSFAFAIGTIIKYFIDFETYYFHNNQTNLILIFSLIFLLAYYCFINFESVKQNWINFLLNGIIMLVSVILMFVYLENFDVNFFYCFNVLTLLSLAICIANLTNPIFKNVFKYFYVGFAVLLMFGVFVTTMISRVVIDIINMVYILSIISMELIIVATLTETKTYRNYAQLVFKVITVALCVAMFIKLVYFDISLATIDLSRLFFIPILTSLCLSKVFAYKDKIMFIFSIIILLIAIATTIPAAIFNGTLHHEASMYITMLVGIVAISVTMLAYFITKMVINKKAQNKIM